MSNEIEPIGGAALDETQTGAFGVAGCVWTPTRLEIPASASYEDYEHIGWALGQATNQCFWSLAEWLAYGEKRWPNRYAQAIESTGRSKGGLMNMASVARRVPRSRRRPELGFGHHAAIAKLSPREQTRWLAIAVAEKLSVEELRGRLREPSEPNHEIRSCPCCGSAISAGTIVRDQICEKHGWTSVEKEAVGLRYFRCGCLEAIEDAT